MQTIRKNAKPLTIILLTLVCAFSLIWVNQTKSTTTTIPPILPLPTLTSLPNFEVTIPSKALLKNYVTVSVKADIGTSCNLIFIPASGEMLNMDTIAGENGECVWRWKLEESYKKGTARLIFTINGVSETYFLQILSSF